ncbi:hypothetical protein U1Q18_041284 [Sarracenia purpurea var. burkii]
MGMVRQLLMDSCAPNWRSVEIRISYFHRILERGGDWRGGRVRRADGAAHLKMVGYISPPSRFPSEDDDGGSGSS